MCVRSAENKRYPHYTINPCRNPLSKQAKQKQQQKEKAQIALNSNEKN